LDGTYFGAPIFGLNIGILNLRFLGVLLCFDNIDFPVELFDENFYFIESLFFEGNWEFRGHNTYLLDRIPGIPGTQYLSS